VKKKLLLDEVADMIEMVSDQLEVHYNTETGEFDFNNLVEPSLSGEDPKRFANKPWIAAPSNWDIYEYGMMADFSETVTDSKKSKPLTVALNGKGAFRRFKEVLHSVELIDEWYKFRRGAYLIIAREWCEEFGLEYQEGGRESEPRPAQSLENVTLDSISIVPISSVTAKRAAEILREAFAWSYDGNNAEQEMRKMLNPRRIALVAMTPNGHVVGIIGAIPQYGTTGWELHPLAVLEEYRWRGFGTALLRALEREVAAREGITIYLGSDDEFGTTSLFGEDLYDDTFGKIANIKNTGHHAYSFYEKHGYKIVGVIPDANGHGKPDIWLAKRIASQQPSL